jgi:hypothetical protein
MFEMPAQINDSSIESRPGELDDNYDSPDFINS